MCTPKPSQRLAASAGRLRRGIGRGIKALLSPARTLGSHIPTSVSYPRTLRETSHSYLGITAAMTQVPVPMAIGASRAWGFNSYNGYWANSGSGKDAGTIRVRACLAF